MLQQVQTNLTARLLSVHSLLSTSVKHILVECTDFNDTRNKYIGALGLISLLTDRYLLVDKG